MVRFALWKREKGLRTIVGDGAAVDAEVDASLEDGAAASVTVDAHPRRRGVRGVASGACRGRRDGERARHGRERVLRSLHVSLQTTFRDAVITYRGVRVVYSAGPVAAVLDMRDVVSRRMRGDLEVLEGAGRAGAGAAGGDALCEAGGDRKGRGGEEHGGQEGGGEHGDSKTERRGRAWARVGGRTERNLGGQDAVGGLYMCESIVANTGDVFFSTSLLTYRVPSSLVLMIRSVSSSRHSKTDGSGLTRESSTLVARILFSSADDILTTIQSFPRHIFKVSETHCASRTTAMSAERQWKELH